MSNPLDALLRPERARTSGRASWFTVLGLVLVPLTIGGLLTWALWQPTQRLSRMQAAVVNLDTPVTLNGQTVPLGRQLAAGLVTAGGADGTATDPASPTAATSASTSPSSSATSSAPAPSASATSGSTVKNVSGSDSSGNFTWVITNADDAAAGLTDGRYATVVTIPSNFSAAATSTADAARAVRATIDVKVSDRAKIADSAVAQAVTSTAVRVLGQQLTTAYLQNVLVGFSTLHDKLGQASDGATKLATGAQGLASGAQQLASGAGQVGTGAQSLASGTAQLASGIGALQSGAGSLSGGAASLSSGVRQVAAQTSSSAATAKAAVPGAQSFASGLQALSAGVNSTGGLAAGTASLSGGATQLQSALDSFLTTIRGLADTCAAATTAADQTVACQQLAGAVASQQTALSAGAAGVAQGAAGLSAAVNTGVNGQPSLAASTEQLAAGGTQLADGVSASATGLQALAGYLQQSATGAHQLAAGAGQAASGASSLASGASQLSAGAGKAAGAAGQVASGASALASGAQQVSSGADQLGTGAGSLGSGADSLASGLGQAVAQLPTQSTDQAKALADIVADPVATTTASTQLFGSNIVPFLLAVALWLGGLATFLVLGAWPARALGSTRSSLALALRAFAPAALIGVVQGVVLTVAMAGALDLTPGRWVALGGIAALTGIAFAAVNQGLVALLRGVGRFASVVVAVVALATVVVSTVPAVLQSVFGVLPPAPALSAMQAITTGTGSIAGPIALLLVWTLLGLGLTVSAIARHRVVPAGQLARWARAA
jgi:putative membrane protein